MICSLGLNILFSFLYVSCKAVSDGTKLTETITIMIDEATGEISSGARARLLEIEADKKQAEEEQKDRRKNKEPFTQVYKKLGWGSLRMMIKENPVACEIFMFLAENMDGGNAVSCPMTVLQEVTGKGRTTVSNAVKYLKERGHLMALKQGTTNVYVLNPSLVWSSWSTAKPYCKFDGSMLVSKAENAEISEQMEKFLKERSNVVSIKEPKVV